MAALSKCPSECDIEKCSFFCLRARQNSKPVTVARLQSDKRIREKEKNDQFHGKPLVNHCDTRKCYIDTDTRMKRVEKIVKRPTRLSITAVVIEVR